MIKKELLNILLNRCKERVATLQKAVDNAQNAANEESKSSAGDKYETGRAMAQNDRDLYARQLLAAQADLNILESIDNNHTSSIIKLGTLVETNIGTFLLSVSGGILDFEEHKYMTTSLESPIGQLLKGKQEGDAFDFRGKKVSIKSLS